MPPHIITNPVQMTALKICQLHSRKQIVHKLVTTLKVGITLCLNCWSLKLVLHDSTLGPRGIFSVSSMGHGQKETLMYLFLVLIWNGENLEKTCMSKTNRERTWMENKSVTFLAVQLKNVFYYNLKSLFLFVSNEGEFTLEATWV